jgi:hypothetical protein
MHKLKISTLIAACAVVAASVAHAQPANTGNTAYFDRYCADHGDAARHARFQEWLIKRLNLNDAQMAAFKAFQDARAKSLDDSKARLCSAKPDLSTFEARLNFGQAFLEARLDALKAENPKLIAFYNSLDDKQKKTFDEIRANSHR